MWSSTLRARAWLLRIQIPRQPILHPQVLTETLVQNLSPPIFTPPRIPRFFSTYTTLHDAEFAIAGDLSSGEKSGEIPATGAGFEDGFDDGIDKGAGFDEKQGETSFKFNDEIDKGASFDEKRSEDEGNGDTLSSLWKENTNGADVFGPASEDEAHEVDKEQVESVVLLLQRALEEPLESSLDVMGLSLSEDFVLQVFETPNIPAESLIGFYQWALKHCRSVKTIRAIELLVLAVGETQELGKMEAYKLWDLVKEIGSEKGLMSTEALNQLILIFCKLGKAKAGLEVFDRFDDFSCAPNGDSYYYTIKALGKRSKFDAAWSVCEKMISSGSLPDRDKLGEIIAFFCKGKKVKEAHSVYLFAKEREMSLQRFWLDSLISGLSRSDETIQTAFEMLDDYSKESIRFVNRSFGSVVKGLCRIGDVQEAKKLVLRMVESGPPPGNAVFNYVITALSKGGEMEDAIGLMKVMESRGLRPDVYTYTVVMSGFAKGGMMDEAYKVFSEARKRHTKLSPATYHVLTRGYCKMEEFEKATQCLKEMKKDGLQPNTDEYNKMIQSLCLKAVDWHKAEELLEEMKESGIPLKGITRSLIAAVKELEGEELQSGAVGIEA